MNHEQARKFIRLIFDDLLNPSYLDKIPMLYHHDVVAEMGDERVYYADIVNRAKYRIEYMKEITSDILEVLVDSDKIVARVKQHYIIKDRTAKQQLECFMIYQLKENKVIKAWGAFTPNFKYRE